MTTKVHSYLGGLGIDATNKLTLAANATVTVGNGTSTGNVHVGGNMSIGNISPGAHDLAIAGTALIGTDATVTQHLTVNGDIDLEGSLDVNGTTNLDVVDIDGAVQLDATLTVGANDQGYDVILYGDTASRNMTWDSSADSLIFSDNTKAVFGAGSDLQIYHSGSDNMIEGVTDEYLFIKHDNLLVRDLANKDQIRTAKDGAVTLYYNSGSKIATTNTGVDVTGNIVVSGTVDGRDIAVNLPASLGDAGQVLKVNDAGNAGEWGDLEAGVGYQNSSTSVIPGTENTDLGNLTDASTDAFGIATSTKYDLMDPIGQLLGLDLGAL